MFWNYTKLNQKLWESTIRKNGIWYGTPMKIVKKSLKHFTFVVKNEVKDTNKQIYIIF